MHNTDGTTLGSHDTFKIFPANIFVTTKERIGSALAHIETDLEDQVDLFNQEGKDLEGRRLYER